MGAEKIQSTFPNLLKEIDKLGLNITWVCDPMHVKTTKSNSWYKTRATDNYLNEIK